MWYAGHSTFAADIGSEDVGSSADLEAYVLEYMRTHCSKQGIIDGLDELDDPAHFTEQDDQCPFAFLSRMSQGHSAEDGPKAAEMPLATYVELELSPQLSHLYALTEHPEGRRKEGEFYVLHLHADGYKASVVERENNILSIEEAQQHAKLAEQAMLDDIRRWHTLGAFKRMDRQLASNVIDARWVLTWKIGAGKRIIQARLVVRGFKDPQASSLSIFAGTTSRWGQRLVSSVAVQKKWELLTADVSQAFLRGLTFEEALKLKDEVHRSVQFCMPPSSESILRMLPGHSDFDSIREVLDMLRCGFGFKDAPRVWDKVLRQLLLDLGLKPVQSDEQMFVWHDENWHDGKGGRGAPFVCVAPYCRLVLSTHVDDLKGAGLPEYRRKKLLDTLKARFGELKIKQANFECVGVMHEQSADCSEIWTHQQHYVPQVKEIMISGMPSGNEEETDDDMRQLYMSLVGALAWLILTMPAICVYVAFLQRHTQKPTVGHVMSANRLLTWVRNNSNKLGVRYRQLQEPIRPVTLSDSAFKAQDYEGLVMRGCVIFLAEAVPDGGDH